MAKNCTEYADRPTLPATAFGSTLAAFPLGSLESRAAARSIIAAREATEGEGVLFEVIRLGGKRTDGPPDLNRIGARVHLYTRKAQ